MLSISFVQTCRFGLEQPHQIFHVIRSQGFIKKIINSFKFSMFNKTCILTMKGQENKDRLLYKQISSQGLIVFLNKLRVISFQFSDNFKTIFLRHLKVKQQYSYRANRITNSIFKCYLSQIFDSVNYLLAIRVVFRIVLDS